MIAADRQIRAQAAEDVTRSAEKLLFSQPVVTAQRRNLEQE